MAKPDFTKPGVESISINGKEYHLEVCQDARGVYGARVELEGKVLAQSRLSWLDPGDSWAWAIGKAAEIARGLR